VLLLDHDASRFDRALTTDLEGADDCDHAEASHSGLKHIGGIMKAIHAHMFRALMIGALAVAHAACTSPRVGVFLATAPSMSRGHYVDQAWSDHQRISAGNYSAIEMAKINTRGILDQKGITAVEAAAALRGGLMGSAASQEIMSLNGTGPKARLELAITEMSPGDAFDRIMAAEFGSGLACVQVEGRVVDPETGALLAAFADRRHGTGVIGFRDLLGDSGPKMVSEMLRGTGADLRRELSYQLGTK
jgi:hypothetical protein